MRVFGGNAAQLQRTTRALHFQLIGIFFPENCYHRLSCTTLQPSPLIMVCLQTVFRMKRNLRNNIPPPLFIVNLKIRIVSYA